jgi:hypothetical protein
MRESEMCKTSRLRLRLRLVFENKKAITDYG